MRGMTSTAPPATGIRTPWEELPEAVRDAVAEVLGGPVVEAVTQTGGFSPGAAARVRTAGGRRAFVKAVTGEVNPHSPPMHRREARNAAALPAEVPAPRLLGTYDDGTWVALVFEDVVGRQPHVPWDEGELEQVLDAVAELEPGTHPVPGGRTPGLPSGSRTHFLGWRKMLDAGDRRRGPGPLDRTEPARARRTGGALGGLRVGRHPRPR